MNIRKGVVTIALNLLVCGLCGCGGEGQAQLDMPVSEGGTALEEQDVLVEGSGIEGQEVLAGDHNMEGQDLLAEAPDMEAQDIAAVCRDIYEEAAREKTMGSLPVVRRIVARLGERGYVAVDSDNQVDMEGAAQAEAFCEEADAGEEAELTVIVVTYAGGFRKYDLCAQGGNVSVIRRDYHIDQEGCPTQDGRVSYSADFWKYTEDGYLLFAGNYYTDDNYMLTMSSTPEHAALRVQPLDERCRELNRQYIMPVGYGKNNLFLTDWSEEDYGNLDLYDLFDCFYQLDRGRQIPYVMDDDLRVGAVYGIPADEFEGVLGGYLDIDRKRLGENTDYFPEKETYAYRPRGFEEAEYPEIPWPEVISYEEKEDGTVAMTVHAVFSNDDTSRAFSHEVVVRPREDGGFAYVSNRMLTPQEECNLWWHTDRLTMRQWEEAYGENSLSQQWEETHGENGLSQQREETHGENGLSHRWEESQGEGRALGDGEACLLTLEERKTLEDCALKAAEQMREVCGDGNINRLTREQCRQVVALLGAAGYVSVAEDANMENYEKVESFYRAYEEGKEAMVTLYNVYSDGRMGVTAFVYREGKLQTYLVETGWREDGWPEIRSAFAEDIAEVSLTENGYFIYTFEDVAAHASLRQYWRIEPLSDKCRELRQKYIFGLRYLDYDILTADWDEGNVADILSPCMFGDIYHIATGENLQLEDGRIPAKVFEEIMTTCFPVSNEQLRSKCGYDGSSDSYPFEMIFASFSAPFGEVVNYAENADGTLSLSVAGVWIEHKTDSAYESTLVVQPFPDGTFRYLSNTMK